MLFMGDINVDFQKWNAEDYFLNSIVDMTKELQADHALQQLVKEYTRMVNISGVFKGSTIDHMYTNVEHLNSYMLVTVIMTLPWFKRSLE